MILLYIALMLAVLAVLVALAVRLQAASHDTEFPPISEAEFLERCGPGTDPEIALGVRRIISEVLNVPYDEIHPSMRFDEDLKAY